MYIGIISDQLYVKEPEIGKAAGVLFMFVYYWW